MSWELWLAAVGFGFLVYALYDTFREHRIGMKRIEDAHQRVMFTHAREELEDLENALTHVQLPPSLKPFESPWNRIRYAADAGCFKIKPWRPPWSYVHYHEDTSVFASATISVCVWTTHVDGLLHRVGRLPMTNGTSFMVLLCDTKVHVTTPVETYDRTRCPLITCLQCVAKVKD